MAVRERPLSPHLLIYRPQLTSILSITHRATGVFLILGALMLANWVIAAAYGADTFATAKKGGAITPLGVSWENPQGIFLPYGGHLHGTAFKGTQMWKTCARNVGIAESYPQETAITPNIPR